MAKAQDNKTSIEVMKGQFIILKWLFGGAMVILMPGAIEYRGLDL